MIAITTKSSINVKPVMETIVITAANEIGANALTSTSDVLGLKTTKPRYTKRSEMGW